MSKSVTTCLSLVFILFVGLIVISCARPAADTADTSASADSVHAGDIHKGNVICLLPDYENGTVEPIVASEPCVGKTSHAHVFLDTRSKQGNVYAVNANAETIERIQAGNKQDVELKGTVSGNQRAWIITVE